MELLEQLMIFINFAQGNYEFLSFYVHHFGEFQRPYGAGERVGHEPILSEELFLTNGWNHGFRIKKADFHSAGV